MKKLFTPLLLTMLVMLAGIAQATNYYFSTATGDDSRTAAQAQNPATPWKTLNKLNSFFASLLPGDNVLFNRGEVFYGSINVNKSGTAGSPIILGAYGTGAKPVITGFTTASAWTNLGNNIWESVSAVSTLSAMNMVVVNGVNTAKGRYPNNGYLTYQSHVGNKSITSSSLNSAVTNWTGAEAVIRIHPWLTGRNLITAHSGGTLTYTQTTDFDASDGFGFYIQNDVRTLDVQNEWYYNPSTKKIRIYSTTSPTNVKVATVSDLVTLSLKNNITFDNIDFQGSNTKTFNIASSANITIQNCRIEYSGQDAVFGNINSGSPSSNFKLQYSTINQTNNNAVFLERDFAGALIANNTITNTGMNDGMGGNGADPTLTAIIGYETPMVVEYNKIDNVGYNGVVFDGSGAIVRNNFITNFCTQKIDGAGIYSWTGVPPFSTFTGQKVYNNIVLNGIGSNAGTDQTGNPIVFGIYLDDGMANVEVYNNTCANNSYAGLYLHNTKDINVHDNTFYNNGQEQVRITSYVAGFPTRNLAFRSNICFSKLSTQRTAEWETLVNEIASFGTASSINSNYYARPIDDNQTIQTIINDYGTATQRTLAGWKTYSGFDALSNKSPKTIIDINDLRFEYNATNSPVVVPLPSNFMDVRGATYNGTITLAPYTSAVLIKNGASTNQAPKANAGIDQTILLPSNTINLSGSGTDPDGTISSYLWTKISGPAAYTISTSNSASTSVTGLVQGVYKFELKVTDNNGTVGKDTMQVTANAAANIAPVANAGNSITITLPANATTLTGSGTDADGTIVSYAWSRVSGPATFTLATANAATTALSNLVQGTYTFRLTVTDNNGATDTDDMTIAVNAAPVVNQTPLANAGNNIVLTLPANSTTLTGSGTDADGTIASYAWSRISGPATFTLATANAATTALSNLVQGTYTFRLTVTDNSGATDTDDMTVIVNAAPVVNEAPTANAGNNIVLTLPANSTTLTGSGTDADGTIVSYAWSRVSGPATFTLATANAATTAVSNLVQGTYTFRLTVTDNDGATDTDDMTVIVNAAPVTNQTPLANAGNNIVLTLPANSTTLTGSGTDADGTIVSYVWSRVSGPATFTLATANAATTALSNLVQGSYTFRLTVTDNDGTTDTDDMTVTVNAAPVVNQAPLANAGNNIVLTLPANSTTLTGSGTHADGTIASYAWSKVSGPATFTLATANAATTALSNLVQGSYTFRLTVTDNSGATDTDDMTVIVNAAPVVNEAPTANAGNNIVLTLPANSTTLTGSGTDADGTIVSYAWSRVSGPATFTLATANAATTAVSNLVQGTYTFRLTVTDNDGATDTDDMTVIVNAAPVTNQTPLANAGNNIVLTLPANSTTLTGSGTDADGTIVSYVWSRVSGPATFTLANANAATTALSNLVQGSYTFRLTVTDNDGTTDTDDMTVTVNAAPVVNQAPLANAGNNIVLTLPANSATLTGSGTDADGTIVTYAWSKVSGPATFTLGTADAATTTLTNLVQGSYTFRLTVTDNDGTTDTDDMTVIVNAAPVTNQTPLANAGNNIVLTLPANSTTLTGSGTDADGTIASYAWSRITGPATFTLANANAVTTALSNLVQGTYTFRLTVTDNDGATNTDDMTVTVNAAPVTNQKPLANAGNNIVLTLPANSTTLTGSGTDADGTIASYAWSKVSGPATFTLGTADAATTTLTNLVQGSYTFRLTVTDNDGTTDTDDMTVTVNVAPVLNKSPIADAGVSQVATLSSNQATLNGSLSRDPDGTIKKYKWEQISGPAIAIIASISLATTKVSGFREGDYIFQLTVTDNLNAIAKDTVTIKVVNNFRSFPGDFMLYPNPATDKITFTLYNEKYNKAKITVYDITGRKVLSTIEVINSQTRFTKTIDIVQLKPGIYFIEAIMDYKEKVTAKFIKQ